MDSQIIQTMVKFNSPQTLLAIATVLTHAAQDKFNEAILASDAPSYTTNSERIALGNAVIAIEQAVKTLEKR